MKNYILTLMAFMAVNFLGLWLGGLATGPGVTSEWYTSLNQAPWTPPGWVFGLAWTIIGATFSVFMTNEWSDEENPLPRALFREALLLNIFWNYVFFGQHTFGAAIMISTLSIIIFIMAHFTRIINGWGRMIWIMPYFIWLMIASSLNWYIVIMN
jgi:tryptophan-rich sensory protein